MIGLHRLLRDHADAVEVDLDRFWGIDLLDYWRRPRTLSTRALLVRRRYIPLGQGSAIRAVEGTDWTPAEDIADLTRRTIHAANTKKHKDPGAHPAHPSELKKRQGPDPARRRKLEAALERKRQREADIAAGRIA